MKENIADYVVSHSEITYDNFNKMNWAEKVDYILKNLAGGSNRWCIYKDFMNFMANHGKECIEMDRKTGYSLAPVLFTVAMQRLSKGAVLHDTVNFRDQLPDKFWEYSSAHDDYHTMTDDCLNFIYNGLPVAAQFEPTKDYALKIAWGLVKHLNEDGITQFGFSLYCNNSIEEGKKLYQTAVKIVEKNASAKDIFSRYATPFLWEKHQAWLYAYLSENKCWNNFFQRIGVSTNVFNLREKMRITRSMRLAYESKK